MPKIYQGLREYFSRIRLFQSNAWLYILNTILAGMAFGVYQIVFNFYILSQGHSDAFLGTLLSINNSTALLGALPAGFVSDWLGRKRAFLVSTTLSMVAIAGIALWRTPESFIMMNIISGLSQSLLGVSGAPFLMENSSEKERSYLFSFNFGIQTIAGFVGNWLGGNLPGWMGSLQQVPATSTPAYGAALLCISGIYLMALGPLALLRRKNAATAGRPLLAPFAYARREPRQLGRLISPGFVTALGAGLLMPFMNVFYRRTFFREDDEIGLLFALGSLAMGIGLLIAPPIADRFGKMRLVIFSQALSIPFLLLMGFAPWYELSVVAYLIRVALMNMSGPVYQAFIMEQVEPEARATVASLNSMSWSFGWAFSPLLSGWLQQQYGFAPVYLGTATMYTLAAYLYYRFFGWAKPDAPQELQLQPAMEE